MFDEVVGQNDLKRQIEIAVIAAKFRGESLGHVLMSGAGGLGKTHFLKSICQELNGHLELTQGNRLSVGEVSKFLIYGCEEARKSGKHPFLVIDEIHEMPLKSQEELYYPMDYGKVVRVGEDVVLGLFTLAGATTALEELDGKSLVNRFAHHWTLSELTVWEINQLAHRYFLRQKMICWFNPLHLISNRSRGNPRLALKYSAKARDYAQFELRNEVMTEDVEKAFSEMGIDELGLDEDQRHYLKILYDSNRPVGLDVLAHVLNEKHPDQIRKLVEPYLWKLGLITSTCRGRELTDLGHRHLLRTEGLAGRL